MNKFVENEFKNLSLKLEEGLSVLDLNTSLLRHLDEIGINLNLNEIELLEDNPFYIPKVYKLTISQITKRWFSDFIFLKRGNIQHGK